MIAFWIAGWFTPFWIAGWLFTLGIVEAHEPPEDKIAKGRWGFWVFTALFLFSLWPFVLGQGFGEAKFSRTRKERDEILPG